MSITSIIQNIVLIYVVWSLIYILFHGSVLWRNKDYFLRYVHTIDSPIEAFGPSRKERHSRIINDRIKELFNAVFSVALEPIGLCCLLFYFSEYWMQPESYWLSLIDITGTTSYDASILLPSFILIFIIASAIAYTDFLLPTGSEYLSKQKKWKSIGIELIPIGLGFINFSILIIIVYIYSFGAIYLSMGLLWSYIGATLLCRLVTGPREWFYSAALGIAAYDRIKKYIIYYLSFLIAAIRVGPIFVGILVISSLAPAQLSSILSDNINIISIILISLLSLYLIYSYVYIKTDIIILTDWVYWTVILIGVLPISCILVLGMTAPLNIISILSFLIGILIGFYLYPIEVKDFYYPNIKISFIWAFFYSVFIVLIQRIAFGSHLNLITIFFVLYLLLIGIAVGINIRLQIPKSIIQ